MMKRLLLLAALLPACLGLYAQNPPAEDLDAKYAGELLKAGTAAPDFTLNDIDGNPVSLSSFRGRQVVLIFWASWCPDCREEVPALQELQAKVNPEKVVFVSVSFDRKEEAFREYVRENKMGGVQLFDAAGKKDSAVAANYHVRWIPSLYLIDADGKIRLGTVMLDKVAKALR